jgi:hypothetical protein
MCEKDIVKKLRESIISQTAWLFEATEASTEERDRTIEAVKVIWNRSLSRAGFGRCCRKQVIRGEDFKDAVEFWSSQTKEII